MLSFELLSIQVRHLDTSEKSELHKLQQLKDEQGWCCSLWPHLYRDLAFTWGYFWSCPLFFPFYFLFNILY